MRIIYIGENILLEDNLKRGTIAQCVNYLNTQKVIGLDIETSFKFDGKYKEEGLDPHLSNIVMLQIGTLECQYVIDVRCINLEPLKNILESPDIVKVGHNIKFEYKHLLNHNIKLCNVYDTMIVEQILYTGVFGTKFSLFNLNIKYLGVKVEKSTRLEFSRIGNKPFTIKQIKYGVEDIIYPLKIKELQAIDIIKKDVSNCVSLEMLFILVLGDIEYKGMHFDTNIWYDTYNTNYIIYENLKEELNQYVLTNYPKSNFINKQLDLFCDDIKCNIQWTSSKQVIKFFNFLSICPKEISKTTKKLSYTVNANVVKASLNTINLNAKAHKRDLLKKYLRFKKSEQAITTFGIAFFKYINPVTKRLHSNYRQILTTGRISSSSPNLQNIPAKPEFRSAFNCANGFKIVNSDYSGQETVILANKSLEPNIIKLLREGGCMHCFVVKALHPELAHLIDKEIKENHKDKRQIAKSAGFAINYGGTGYTISNNLGISIEKGDEVYNAYFKAFPLLKEYFRITQRIALSRGYILIDPITGRKNWFRPPRNNRERGAIKRLALNAPIQGEAAGITKYAPILFRKWILENNLENVISITNLVHDEINVEVVEKYAELAAKNLEKCMAIAGDKWCKTIPLKADAVITNYWTH